MIGSMVIQKHSITDNLIMNFDKFLDYSHVHRYLIYNEKNILGYFGIMIKLNLIKKMKRYLGLANLQFWVSFFLITALFNLAFPQGKLKKNSNGHLIMNNQNGLDFDISSMPNFCGHEHWGSINSNGGFVPELNAFRADVVAGAQPQQTVSIWDIVLDPYLTGWFYSGGLNPNALANAAGFATLFEWWKSNPQAALDSFKEFATSSILTGTFQCTALGIEYLYGVNILDFKLKDWQAADSLIGKNYSEIFSWYETAMKKAHFTELIRPVHPEFYLREQSPETAKEELSFTHIVLRIDPFMDMWKADSKRRDDLAKAAGVEPVDATSWKVFIKFYFDLAQKNNTVGIKQLQAYSRDLGFRFREDKEVRFRGELNADEILAFQDWIVHECSRLANERNWVHQIHVGTHNLESSNPLPLASLGDRYPNMNIVMLHCWPFFEEAAFLAKNKPNFYIDSCWVPILSTDFFSQSLDTYLNYVPYSKILLGHDATTVEMAVGSSIFTRQILEEKLLEQKSLLKLHDKELRKAALDMLQNNAVSLYGFGTKAE